MKKIPDKEHSGLIRILGLVLLILLVKNVIPGVIRGAITFGIVLMIILGILLIIGTIYSLTSKEKTYPDSRGQKKNKVGTGCTTGTDNASADTAGTYAAGTDAAAENAERRNPGSAERSRNVKGCAANSHPAGDGCGNKCGNNSEASGSGQDVRQRPFSRVKPEDPEAIRKAKRTLEEAGNVMEKIRNSEVKAAAMEGYGKAGRLIEALTEQPEDIRRCSQLFNYYIPTYLNVLQKYVRLEEGGINLKELPRDAVACLQNIREVFIRQYDSLFSNEVLDLTVEMKALDAIMKRDGFAE